MKNLKHFFFASLFLSVFATIQAQTVPQKLDNLLTRTLDSMRTIVKAKSLSAAIQFNNNTIWVSAKGISAENPITPATPNHTYLIGSVAKTMTAACILQLVDEKKLNLDDSLFAWVDTFRYINPNITIRQLLRHQSGIYDVLQNPANQPALLANKDSIWSYKDLIKTFIKPATFQPGKGWAYCNTNYFLLAMIIEKATGQPYYKELRKRFFTPLALNSIKIPAHESLPPSVAHVWIDLTGDGITDDAHNFYTSWNSLNAVAGSAGGYYGTASDISKWMRTYMRGDLHTAPTLAAAKVTIPATGMSVNYGLGLMERSFLGLKAYGHGGDLSYSAFSWYFPSKDISITILNNDSKVLSWSLNPTVTELLRTYLKYEALLDSKNAFEKDDLQLSVSPNPFSESVKVQLNLPEGVAEAEFVLSNTLGAQLSSVKKQDLPQGEQLIAIEKLDHLTNGLYFMSVYLDGKIAKTVKILKN